MPHYVVFLGAPSPATVLSEDQETAGSRTGSASWIESDFTIVEEPIQDQTDLNLAKLSITQDLANEPNISGLSQPRPSTHPNDESGSEWLSLSGPTLEASVSLLPKDAFDKASQKLSKLYQNVIFNEDGEDEPEQHHAEQLSLSEDSSVISWEPTYPEVDPAVNLRASPSPRSNMLDAADPPKSSTLLGNKGGSENYWDNSKTQDSELYLNMESADSELTDTLQDTFDVSNEGEQSIARLPSFHFALHRLSSLAELMKVRVQRKEQRNVSMVVAILEVDGPDQITTKKGQSIFLLKFVVGDEDGGIAKITIWRELAEQWGGPDGARKGDVVLLENLSVTYAPPEKPTLSASPYEKSNIVICYRTLPIYPSDRRYRPDLRLAANELSVRKVASVVSWIGDMIGIR